MLSRLSNKLRPVSIGRSARLSTRNFRPTRPLRWICPESLSTSELRQECERRELSVSGNRSALLDRIRSKLMESGGYDNGLTLDENLVANKRQIENEMNKVPNNQYIKSKLAVERQVVEKLREVYEEDERVTFHKKSPQVTLEGRYAEMCALRSQVAATASDLSSTQTVYSFPHNIVLRLKTRILKELHRDHDVSFTVSRPDGSASEMILLTVHGESAQRMNACDALESIVNRIRCNEFDVPPLESYSRPTVGRRRRHKRKQEEQQQHQENAAAALVLTPDPLTGHNMASDCFNTFQGTVLYMDVRMKEMLLGYRNRLDSIAQESDTKVYMGTSDLFWLSDCQLAIEGDEKGVSQARTEIDQLMNQLKSLTMTIVLPTHVNASFVTESQQIASEIQKLFGVDTVMIEHDDEIFVHLIGTSNQVNCAAGVVDARLFKLNQRGGSVQERQLTERRDRIRNLDFMEMGIGGLDDSLRHMIRRTFESRLISHRLRKELGLTHVRGVLLYGAPGTGKTLIARKISDILGCKEPKIVNGPEIESKWVGEAEKKNIRALFEDAMENFEEKGPEECDLHVVIFDEIDSIAKKRGGAHGKSRDGALNQLLCCLDGVRGCENVLVFGLTNRKDCLDPALLRPGRLEAQLEIQLPDANGRWDILKIHTASMQKYGRLGDDVDLRLLSNYCEGFSGADLAGMVRSAISFGLESLENEDEDNLVISQMFLEMGLHEIRHAKDRISHTDDEIGASDGLLQA